MHRTMTEVLEGVMRHPAISHIMAQTCAFYGLLPPPVNRDSIMRLLDYDGNNL